MPKRKPTTHPQQRALADELHAIRTAQRMSMQWVADQLGWSQSKVSRTETGKRPIFSADVIALLAIYRVTGERRDKLVAMARDSTRANWLETDRLPGVPSQATTLARYESEAVRITYMDLVLVTGLFQTPAYARAVMRGAGITAQDIEPRVAVRMERQKILDEPEPPQVVSFMDEAALRREVGGRRVMAEQLRRLLTEADRPNVELRVVPFDHGGHAAVDGTFTLLEFADAPPFVHFEHTRAGVFLHDIADVRPYVDIVANLGAVALDHARSIKFVADVMRGYERE